MNLKFKKENFFFGINNSLLKNSWIKNKPDTRLSLNISQKYLLPNNIANILALRPCAIRSFYAWMQEKEYRSDNPAEEEKIANHMNSK